MGSRKVRPLLRKGRVAGEEQDETLGEVATGPWRFQHLRNRRVLTARESIDQTTRAGEVPAHDLVNALRDRDIAEGVEGVVEFAQDRLDRRGHGRHWTVLAPD